MRRNVVKAKKFHFCFLYDSNTITFTHLCASGFSLISAFLSETNLSELHNSRCHFVHVRPFGLGKAQDVEGSLENENVA